MVIPHRQPLRAKPASGVHRLALLRSEAVDPRNRQTPETGAMRVPLRFLVMPHKGSLALSLDAPGYSVRARRYMLRRY